MTAFNAFSWFGGASFSSRKTYHQLYFELLQDGQGDNYSIDWTSHQTARLFAMARVLASAQLTLDRAFNNANPLKATELLPDLEAEYGIVPAPGSTLVQRRRELAARVMIVRGAGRVAVQDALTLLLGGDFVEYRTTSSSGRVVSPTTLALAAAQGTFVADGRVRKDIRILSRISTGLGAPQNVGFEGLDPSLPIPVLTAGEKLLVDPGVQRETVTILAVNPTVFQATFTKAHDAGSPATTALVPSWSSTQRHALVILSASAAIDAEKRRKTHDLCRRIFRGVSTWAIVDNSGPFRVGVGRIGVTTIGAL